jgi:hypothetical protein
MVWTGSVSGGVDGAGSAERVIRCAHFAGLAVSSGARMHLVHVTGPIAFAVRLDLSRRHRKEPRKKKGTADLVKKPNTLPLQPVNVNDSRTLSAHLQALLT